MQPKAAVSSLCKTAGSGPDAVARRLRRAGSKGEPNDPYSCPVAVWLRAKCPGFTFYVNADSVVRYARDGEAGVHPLDDAEGDGVAPGWHEVDAPELQPFIDRLDGGDYLDLVAGR